VYKIPVYECDKYVTCSSCLAAADPFCGWCTMQARSSLVLIRKNVGLLHETCDNIAYVVHVM